MKVVKLSQGETYRPEPGWKRVSLAGSDKISIEYFEKPAGHSSPMHSHPSEQVSVVLRGKMKVVSGDGEEELLGFGDSAWFAPNEPHRIENSGTELAVGVDIFVPARSFDFWTKRKLGQ